MKRMVAVAKRLLSNIELFSRYVLRLPLRRYQLEPIQAVLDSVLHRRGLEFLLVFPRQSGKNEVVAHLLVYLMNLFQRVGGNMVFGAIGDGVGRMIQRLEMRLENAWNAGRWQKGARPRRRILNKAAVVFLSTHPMASARGETAHWLMIIDELQDQDANHLEAVFEPMRAANNATSLSIGTVKLTTDALWSKKLQLERLEKEDGIQRVFLVGPERVIAENDQYATFLETKVRQLGRYHPIVASEYYLEPIDGAGGLFNSRRIALMRGSHRRQSEPLPGQIYLATLDVAGQDEAATDPLAQLRNPARDYTVAHIFQVVFPPEDEPTRLPHYQVMDVFVDHGSRHFQDTVEKPALVKRLAVWLERWNVAHLVADQSGVGQGVADWLAAVLGRDRVAGFDFAGAGKKAALGCDLISVIETGRFHYWTGDEDQPLSDGWWFWQQVTHCSYSVPADGRFDRDLEWGVPALLKIGTPIGRQLVHDDRLLSAALIAEADRLYRQKKFILGSGESAMIAPIDPLKDRSF